MKLRQPANSLKGRAIGIQARIAGAYTSIRGLSIHLNLTYV